MKNKQLDLDLGLEPILNTGSNLVEVDQFAGMGSEGVEIQDLIIPFLRIAQPLSPQVTEDNSTTKAGDFTNSATLENYGKEIRVLVVGTSKVYNHWRDVEKGGGFLGSFSTDDPVVLETLKKGFQGAKQWIDDETYLAETFNFALIITSHNNASTILALTSSGIKSARKWLTFMMLQKNPAEKTKAFFHREYILTTFKENKKVGAQTQTWYTPVFKPAELLSDASLVNKCVEFNKFFASYKPKMADDVAEVANVEEDIDF